MARKTKPAPTRQNKQTVPLSKGKEETVASTNVKTLNAIIVKALGEEQSQQLSDDPMFTAYGNIIPPPYPILHLETLRENSTELGQCQDAMVTNIDGFGYRLIETQMTPEKKKSLEKEINAERAYLKGFLDNVNFEEDITKLRMETRQNIEGNGNGWWEIIPFAKKEKGVSSLERIEPDRCRWTKQDKEFTKTEIGYYNEASGVIEKRAFKRRFRRVAHKVNSKIVYLKEWGDPRIIDRRTGEASNKTLAKKYRANSVKHFGAVKSTRSPYHLPRYIGNLFSIYGSRSSDEINFVTFENNNIPSMIIMVSNGQLTEGSVKRVQEFIDTRIKGSSNRSSVLIIEAEPADEAQINPGTMKMEIKDVSGAQKDDQLFQNYDKNNGEKLRRCFRLPPIFVGKSEDYNRSTAQESRKLADEQVFSPERIDFDRFMNRFLVTEFEMKHHIFKSNSANVTNDQDLVKILNGGEKTGGVTPNISREILGDILNRELPKYNKDEAGFDPDVPLSVTLVGLASAVGGNDQSGVIAPNKGQIPKDKVKKNQNAFELIEKILMDGLNRELGVDPLVDLDVHYTEQIPDEAEEEE